MLQLGRNINNLNDKLENITVKQLIHYIRNAPFEIKELIEQIKNIKLLDKNKFISSLNFLPYFTYSIFNPPFRKKGNFGCIYYFPFLLDYQKNVYQKISEIEEVLCAFKTIEEDKILIFLKLTKPIYDEVIFYSVYNDFIDRFVNINFCGFIEKFKKIELDGYFHLNYDNSAYFNENCKEIDTEKLIDDINYSKINISTKSITNNDKCISEDILSEIRIKIGIKKAINRQKKYLQFYEKFDKKQDYLIKRFKEEGIINVEIKKIFKGRKILLNLSEEIWGELNIFIHDNGYTILEAVKKGMDKNLIEMAKIILKQELILK